MSLLFPNSWMDLKLNSLSNGLYTCGTCSLFGDAFCCHILFEYPNYVLSWNWYLVICSFHLTCFFSYFILDVKNIVVKCLFIKYFLWIYVIMLGDIYFTSKFLGQMIFCITIWEVQRSIWSDASWLKKIIFIWRIDWPLLVLLFYVKKILAMLNHLFAKWEPQGELCLVAPMCRYIMEFDNTGNVYNLCSLLGIFKWHRYNCISLHR